MNTLLISTKTHIPVLRKSLVARPRLIERLNEGMESPLTLVAAPAGYGKTTTVSAWIRQNKVCVTWLSLDEGDNEPTQFWTYFVAALQTLRSGLGENAMVQLSSLDAERSSIETFLTALLNEISAFPDEFALVLDDYHVITTQTIHQGIAFLLGHLPNNFHLVICSRTDLPLPLARLRARNQLIELRADDLRFTLEETAIFLNHAMGLHLSPDNIAAVEARTEGWIAGLQLVALSIQEDPDINEFISSFVGSQRFILDYLVDEVLQRQPEEVRSFLRQTSILDRFTGPLCEAVTGQTSGQEMLERLEQSNLFIVSLDDRREWFRYQHLFMDVLRSRLKQNAPDRISDLHRRAATWLEANGMTLEAISHSLAGNDYELAFRLITALNRSDPVVLQHWIRTLPEALERSYPELSIQKAYAQLSLKHFSDAEGSLREAERNARGDSLISGKVSVARATVASVRGESDRVIELAQQARMHLPPGMRFQQGDLAMSLGIAYRLQGNVLAARQALAEAASPEQSVGNPVAVTATGELGRLLVLEGHLRHAGELFQQALAFSTDEENGFLLGVGRPLIYLGQLEFEWDNLDLAIQHFTQGIQRSQEWWLLPTLIEGYLGLARVQQAQGDLEATQSSLQRAAELAEESDIRYMMAITDATKAQLLVTQGNLDASAAWVTEHLHVLDRKIEYSEAGYCEQTALARWLIARGREQSAGSFLRDATRLLQGMRARGREGWAYWPVDRNPDAAGSSPAGSGRYNSGEDSSGPIAYPGRAGRLPTPFYRRR